MNVEEHVKVLCNIRICFTSYGSCGRSVLISLGEIDMRKGVVIFLCFFFCFFFFFVDFSVKQWGMLFVPRCIFTLLCSAAIFSLNLFVAQCQC